MKCKIGISNVDENIWKEKLKSYVPQILCILYLESFRTRLKIITFLEAMYFSIIVFYTVHCCKNMD